MSIPTGGSSVLPLFDSRVVCLPGNVADNAAGLFQAHGLVKALCHTPKGELPGHGYRWHLGTKQEPIGVLVPFPGCDRESHNLTGSDFYSYSVGPGRSEYPACNDSIVIQNQRFQPNQAPRSYTNGGIFQPQYRHCSCQSARYLKPRPTYNE